MNLQQLRFIRETIRQDFNLTEASRRLYCSQPGMSKAIIELEEELGFQIFERHGKRLRGLTAAGKQISPLIDDILRQVENLQKVSADLSDDTVGALTIGCTHAQARYFLPQIILAFRQKFPQVRVNLSEGDPPQLAQRLLHDEVDVAFATETLGTVKGIVTLPCYEWSHVLIMRPDHPLADLTTAQARQLSLAQIHAYPIITYDRAFSGRTYIDEVFAAASLVPDVVMEAIDADVIKTYVDLGLGIGLIAGVAFDVKRDSHLVHIPVGHLFGRHITRVGLRQGVFARDYLIAFLKMATKDAVSADAVDALFD